MTKVCAFGDSVLKGIVLSNDKYKILTNNFSTICENILGVNVENKAKFGSTISVGEKSLERNLENIKNPEYKYIIFEFGGNDCDYNWKEISENPDLKHNPNSTIENFNKGYTELIKKVKNLNKIPVLLSLPPVDSEKYFNKVSIGLNSENILKWMNGNKQHIANWHERYNLEVFKIATENNVPIIDITSKFLEAKDYSQYLCEDGIHPNEEGHKLIASIIKEYLDSKNIILQ